MYDMYKLEDVKTNVWVHMGMILLFFFILYLVLGLMSAPRRRVDERERCYRRRCDEVGGCGCMRCRRMMY